MRNLSNRWECEKTEWGEMGCDGMGGSFEDSTFIV
jgi:hypothetical protein